MVTLEGEWDCTQCETKGIPGRELKCLHCGDPRNPLLDPEERPYLPTDAATVTDEQGLRLAELGPNWNCGKCGNSNLNSAILCSNPECSEPLNHDDDVAGVYTYVSGVYALGVDTIKVEQLDEDRVNLVLEDADNLRELETAPLYAPSRTLNLADLPRRGIIEAIKSQPYRSSVKLGGKMIPKTTLLIGAVVTAIMLVIGGGSVVYNEFFKTSTVTLTVDNMTWERQVEVEEFRTLTQEDWTYPADARIQSQRQEIHHYVKVQTGTKQVSYQVPKQVRTGSHTEQYACGSRTVDKGNGFFSQETTYCPRVVDDYTTVYETKYRDEPVYRQDPVYRTKYIYQIDRWVTDRYDTSKGESTTDGVSVAWPVTTASGDKERIGDDRNQQYTVALTDPDGRSFTESLDYDRWSLLSEGETLNAQQTRRGALRSVSWPDE